MSDGDEGDAALPAAGWKPGTGGTVIPRDPTTDKMLKSALDLPLVQAFPGVQKAYTDAQAKRLQNPNDANVKNEQNAAAALANLADELANRGLDIDGTPLTDDEKSTAQGNLSARWAELQKGWAELDVSKQHYERSDATDAAHYARADATDAGNLAARNAERGTREDELRAKERNDRVSATLDLLRQQVARGDLSATEARDKSRAAFDAASIQRDLINANAGKNMPAGSQYFPGMGPGGAAAQMAASLGLPFAPYATGGTFNIDPGALAAPITAAQSGPSAVPGLDAAIANASRVLVGQGVPV